MLRRLVILASGGLLMLGSACGGDSSKSTNASSEGDAATVTTAATAAPNNSGGSQIENCDTIGADEVAGIFGGDFGAMQDSSQAGTRICTTQRGEPVTSAQYTIKPTSAGEYDATIEYSKKTGAKAESVSGIGEKATRLTNTQYGVTVIQVIAVKGSALFYVTVSGEENYTSQAEQLAKLLAEAL